MRTESIVKLREAEKAELEWKKPARPPEVLEEEKLSEERDESKYQDLISLKSPACGIEARAESTIYLIPFSESIH